MQTSARRTHLGLNTIEAKAQTSASQPLLFAYPAFSSVLESLAQQADAARHARCDNLESNY